MTYIEPPLMFFDNRLMCSGFFAVIVVMIAVAGEAGAQPSGITTGNVDRYINAKIPEAPTGFASTAQVMLAISQKRIPSIDPSIQFRGVKLKRNVRYSTAAKKRGVLDLYSPKRSRKPRIGLILVHGGGWRTGSKEDYRYYGQQFAHRGFATACINYRLVPQARFPAPVQDVKCAVRWMRANAKALNVDPDRIAIMGGSAGGHLCLLAGYSDDVEEFEEIGGHSGVSSQVQAIIDLYGPTDFSQEDDKSVDLTAPMIRDFLGSNLAIAKQNIKLASPITHLDKNDPPTLILHGSIDSLVPVMQSDRLAKKLEELQVPYVYDRLPGWPHAMDLAKPVNDRVLFLAEHFLNNALVPTGVKGRL